MIQARFARIFTCFTKEKGFRRKYLGTKGNNAKNTSELPFPFWGEVNNKKRTLDRFSYLYTVFLWRKNHGYRNLWFYHHWMWCGRCGSGSWIDTFGPKMSDFGEKSRSFGRSEFGQYWAFGKKNVASEASNGYLQNFGRENSNYLYKSAENPENEPNSLRSQCIF